MRVKGHEGYEIELSIGDTIKLGNYPKCDFIGGEGKILGFKRCTNNTYSECSQCETRLAVRLNDHIGTVTKCLCPARSIVILNKMARINKCGEV